MTHGKRFCLISLACMSWALSAVVVHVILLWQDPATQKWQMLLSRNVGVAIWTDFDRTGDQDPLDFAKATIRDFTRGRYNEHNVPLENSIDIILYGQHFFFAPVNERLQGGRLMRKARNRYKHDFTWVPMEDYTSYKPLQDYRLKKSGRITADPNLREVVRIVWPEVQKKFEGLAGNGQENTIKKVQTNMSGPS